MFFVYLLESSKSGELYVGFTNDLKRRLEEHNHNESHSTKGKGPWKCIYFEACCDEGDARRREKYLKTSQGRRMMKRRLKEYFYKKRR